MQLILNLDIPSIEKPIDYTSKLLLIGSCFSENMHEKLKHAKFNVISNPHGILFNPVSVADSISSYVSGKSYTHDELFHLNELWNSWEHHTKFSDVDKDAALAKINTSQQTASEYIKTASHIVITLGSAFQYYLVKENKPVANNHRAPGQWFEKRLLSIDTIVEKLSGTVSQVKSMNPDVSVIFTISPVRHIRDGVVDNNRSKARLIEAVHTLCESIGDTYYFPAYELVIDILRDYRYYDIDFVHPNYLATGFVWEAFIKACIDPKAYPLMKELQDVSTARNHKPRFPDTESHKAFMKNYLGIVQKLRNSYPSIDLDEELNYFSSNR